MKTINIFGARQNNLKNISLQIPKNKITVFTGVSGSGKSSLVFETIGAEAQRQINETQNSFIRNRLQQFGVADVDNIENLNVPVIINQKRIGGNARSTVGTVTDIYAGLRLLFSRIGKPFIGYSNDFSFNNPSGMCPECMGLGTVNKIDIEKLIDKNRSLNEGAIQFPTFQPQGWRWTRYVHSGYFENDKKLKNYSANEFELLLHAAEHKPKHPDKAWGKTVLYEGVIPRIEKSFLKKDSKEFDLRKPELARVVIEQSCPLCKGARLNQKTLSCKINGKNIADCSNLSIDGLLDFIRKLDSATYETVIAELTRKLENMLAIGLKYLTLNRTTSSLSGGESQRIKMVKHLGNSLVDLLYIFDEPSIGLHPRDVDNINNIIKQLRDKGNTILLVEHDPDMIRIADHIVDMGPLSGKQGGELVYEGSFSGLKRSAGLTGRYLREKRHYNKHPKTATSYLEVKHARLYNLKDISVRIPGCILTVVTGVAGSGKSTLINKVLPQNYPEIKIIDQSIFTASARSNLLTFLNMADQVRNAFAKTNHVKASLFSNNGDGACPQCKGLGVQTIDLAFMEDVKEECDLCRGSGFKPGVLKYRYNGKDITEVMRLTVDEAVGFFKDEIFSSLFSRLSSIGINYLTLGQRLNTLSGGERQRLKLAKELGGKENIIVLDEPSTGLHPSDTKKLIGIIEGLVARKNTVIVIEHNLDIIACADWIIDIGPGAGSDGGQVVFEGPVSALLKSKNSETGKYLRQHFS